MTATQEPAPARILVVDDDPSSREGLAMLLRSEGFVVESAGDGGAALEKAGRFDPDLVLTDLYMPRLDGIELCARLRERDAELPVILLTVHDDATSILRGLRVGVDDYLAKPLDIDLVLWTLRHTIGKRALRVEQQHLRSQNAQLYAETQAALERYEEVLSVVSHDLRSPLGIVQLSARRLLDQGAALGMEVTTAAETILRAVARSTQLVDNLLDEARLRGAGMTLDRRDHEVGELLDDVGELRPLALHLGIELDVQPTAVTRPLFCDRAKMAQVLSNLVGNAIKFSPKAGKVSVSAVEGERDVRFTVRDRGPGIPEDARPHLFERFWRAPGRTTPGLGLGLYIAKGIVDAHGGRIWVETPEGTGSAFLVSLPTALEHEMGTVHEGPAAP